ncbi:hypothetical protein [Sandaracinus amylolyticus]|uniref:PH domain-containing protein n=1 Tax=Sandaracinus amylolyticus TaxID=927083 RepID=A0A0F6SFJ4_9BACT|nr:hypothetical protein [Sandaracinus amylolyticus]AKF07049.1 hypothetical protein DB32_004198 [Sandaracinus amylolyticus]
MSEWIETARAVARGTREAPAGWQVIRGERPALIDAESVRGLLATMVAVIAWAGAVFREMVAGTPLDPLALFMRLVALAMTVRAALFLRELWQRVRVWSRATSSTLVLAPEGLYAQLPDEEAAVDKHEIVGVSERGVWQSRSAGRRYSPVYVVVASAMRTHVELPPIFDATPGVLAERLMRWRGVIELPEEPQFPAPASLASKVYDDAARGIRDPGTLVIQHGDGWIRRGPWATVLLGIAIVEGFLRASPEERDALGAAVVFTAGMALVLTPVVWVWLTRRSIAPRQGLAMVMTPAELLMRTRAGVLRVRWSNLQRLSIDTRGRLSPIEGWAIHRALVIKRKDGPPITYDEAFLGVPAEVALTLCDAHASGALLPASGELSRELPEPTADRGTEREPGDTSEPGDR